jgi:hypothetical protein
MQKKNFVFYYFPFSTILFFVSLSSFVQFHYILCVIARLDKISGLQGVLKDFTVVFTLYMKIWIFGLSRLWFFSVEKEHFCHTNNDHIDISSVAHHMTIKLKCGRRLCVHKFDVTSLKLLKNVTNSRKLDAYESIFLLKQ